MEKEFEGQNKRKGLHSLVNKRKKCSGVRPCLDWVLLAKMKPQGLPLGLGLGLALLALSLSLSLTNTLRHHHPFQARSHESGSLFFFFFFFLKIKILKFTIFNIKCCSLISPRKSATIFEIGPPLRSTSLIGKTEQILEEW